MLGLSLVDGWAFKNNVVIKNHRNLQDRLQAAHLLLDRSPRCPVVVDTMKNQSSQLYAALPDRLYVLQEGRILYKVVTTPTPIPGQGSRESKEQKEASHQADLDSKSCPAIYQPCNQGQVLSFLGAAVSFAKWRFWLPCLRGQNYAQRSP